MKKKTIYILGVIVILITSGIITYATIYKNNKNELSNLKYDILIEEHRYEHQNTPLDQIPESTYCSNYYYIVVNSKEMKQYTIIYQDINKNDNDKGDIDTITINTKDLSDEELKEILKNNTKLNKLNNVDKLLEKHITEEYILSEDR